MKNSQDFVTTLANLRSDRTDMARMRIDYCQARLMRYGTSALFIRERIERNLNDPRMMKFCENPNYQMIY